MLKMTTPSGSLSGRRIRWPLVTCFMVLMTCASVRVVPAEDIKDSDKAKCDVHHTACTQDLPDLKVTLDINPKPVEAMQDLTFTVILSGKNPTALPYIDLGMPGMHMGPNRVHLKSAGNGRYEGQGVIVRCPSGRRIWQATVTVPGSGSAEFLFDVVY